MPRATIIDLLVLVPGMNTMPYGRWKDTAEEIVEVIFVVTSSVRMADLTARLSDAQFQIKNSFEL